MANNIWSNYTEKTATPVDADEVMVRDSTDGKNKKLLFGTFWKWVAKKLNEATISELQTNNKTIIGAINALNSEIGYINPIKQYVSNADVVTTLRALINKGQRSGYILFVGNSTGLPDGLTAGVVEYLTTYGTGIIYLRYDNEFKYYRGVISAPATVPTWTSLI